MKDLIVYLKEKFITHKIEDGYLFLEDKKYTILDSPSFDQGIQNIICEEPCVYFFCGRWYLQESDSGIDGIELMNIGVGDFIEPNFAFLGVHGSYEIMNGVGIYKQWVKKAKFMQVGFLGICEENTLAGTISFQKECIANNIKPVLGMTLKYNEIHLKLYVKNRIGWQELLRVSNGISYNLDISDMVSDISKNIVVVADPKKMHYNDLKRLNRVDYYQLEGIEFKNSVEDNDYLQNLEHYINSDIPPVSITDAYYTEKEYSDAKYLLNTINKSFGQNITGQYLKNNDEYISELNGMGIPYEMALTAINNQNILANQCSFTIDTNTWMMPKYTMTQKESDSYSNNNDYFIALIKSGILRLGLSTQKYMDRVKKEVDVLKRGGFIDYFLILHDIMRFARQQNMLVGLARGSAAGSLVAYLLDITKIDPLEFDLIFERFLNEGRIPQPNTVSGIKINSKKELHNRQVVRIKRNGREFFTEAQEIIEGDNLLDY